MNQGIQLCAKRRQLFRVESASRMADAYKLVPFEHTQDKGAEILPAPSRFRESRNHPFLRKPRLHLEPLPASFANLVRTLSMFGDDPFQPLFFGDPVKQYPLSLYMIAEAYFRDSRENLLQEFFPLEQGETGQIMPLEVGQIKDVVQQVTASRVLVMLQKLKIRLALVIHNHNFSVQDSLKSEFTQRLRNRKKLFLEGGPVTGVQGNSSVPDLRHGPVPVPFHFKEPIRMVKRFFDQGREHRFQIVRHRFKRRILQLFAFHCFAKPDLV